MKFNEIRSTIVSLGVLLLAANAAFGETPQEYRVTFDALWSATDHPTNFPSSAHFSPLIGASHGAGYDMWTPGEAASIQVERVAEIGSASFLQSEINTAIVAGTALSLITGPGPDSPGVATTNTFQISSDHPFLSLITMVAPTHDWFVGLDSLDLRNGTGGFKDEVIIDLVIWDAGTEPGTNFSTSGSAVEGGVIHLLDNPAQFFGSDLPIARMTITRIGPLVGDLNFDGVVDSSDLGLLIGAFGTNNPIGDINCDQFVDSADLGQLIVNFGASTE